METLLSQLTSKGYEVNPKSTTNHIAFLKTYGTKRSDCSGGYISVLDDGTFVYDVFNGGFKYGEHLNSFSGEYDDGLVDTLPEEDIINFLNWITLTEVGTLLLTSKVPHIWNPLQR